MKKTVLHYPEATGSYLNSDKQLDFSAGFDLTPHVLETKLTDAAETGGLFGLRFG